MFRALIRSVNMSGLFLLLSLMSIPFPPECLGLKFTLCNALTRQLAVVWAQFAGEVTEASAPSRFVTQESALLREVLTPEATRTSLSKIKIEL